MIVLTSSSFGADAGELAQSMRESTTQRGGVATSTTSSAAGALFGTIRQYRPGVL
jgi:hypothetical protein